MPTPQNPRLEDPRRDPQRTPTLPQTRQCCDDPLNLVNTYPLGYTNRLTEAGIEPSVGLGRRLLRQRHGRIGHRTVQDGAHQRERTLAGPRPPRVRHPRIRRPVSTTDASSNQSGTSHQPREKPTTTLNTTQSGMLDTHKTVSGKPGTVHVSSTRVSKPSRFINVAATSTPPSATNDSSSKTTAYRSMFCDTPLTLPVSGYRGVMA